MKTYLQQLALALSICLAFPHPSKGQWGNNNQTGPTGEYNGSITTGGSYDPYTGNGKRFVDDLTVAGSVGAYPLKWTRVLNTRGGEGPFGAAGAWSHSYRWGMWIRIGPPNGGPEGPDGAVVYPDGRKMDLRCEGEHTYVQADGNETMDRLEYKGSGNYDLLLQDGGKVEFQHPPGPGLSLRATRIVDPYGQATVLEHDTFGRLSKIREESGGRYLQLTYTVYTYTVTWNWTTTTMEVPVISKVQAFTAIGGQITETVDYQYTEEVLGQVHHFNLAQVDYADGHAYYTYFGSPGNYVAGRIKTCQDVRYAGAMSNIKYDYLLSTDIGGHPVAVGQVKAERNLTTGQVVSQVTYPQWHCCAPLLSQDMRRTETRGDGQTRVFQYSMTADPWLESYTDFKNQTSHIDYGGSPNGYLKILTDARQNQTFVERENIADAVISVKRGSGLPVKYEYWDPANPYHVKSKTDERNHTTYYYREPVTNRIWRTEYPGGGWEEFTYNDLGQVRTHKRSNGVYDAYDHFEYDARGRLLKRWDPTPDSAYPPSAGVPYSHFTYYESDLGTDRVQFAYDQRNYHTEYRYDARGNVTRVTHHDGTYSQSGYNPDGTLAWSADENHPGADTNVSERTRYEYDEYKRVTKVTNPMGEIARNSYDPGTNPSVDLSLTHTTSSVYRTTSPMLKKTEFKYDENFRRTRTIQAPGTDDEAITKFTYDEVGNLHSTEDPRSKITTFEYDDRNRQTSVKNESLDEPETTSLEYDDAGNKTKETRPDTAFRRWEYDDMNRLWHAFDWRKPDEPEAPKTTYVTDIAGNVRQIIDAKEAVYAYGYDLKNLKISQTFPVDATGESRTVGMHYDAAGNLDYFNNPAGQWKHVEHDSRNRPWHSWWDGGVGPDIVTTYDHASRVESIVTNNGETTVAFGYDEANRKIWEDQTLALQPPRRVKTDLDPDGKRMNLQIVDPPMEGGEFIISPEMLDGGVYSLAYGYTERNQLKTISGTGEEHWAFNYTYDRSGNMTARGAVYNGRSHSTNCANYDALNRPTTWEQTGPVEFYALSHYKYDKANREVATWRDEESGRGERFAYDSTNQLSKASYNAENVSGEGDPVNAFRTVTYAYTPNKLNRSSVTESTDPSGTGGTVSTYLPNTLNQYTSVGGMTYSYDQKFNLTATGAFFGVYDAANHLVSASNSGTDAPSILAGFVYDGLGRCVKRTLGTAATVFIYDGWKPIAEFEETYPTSFKAWNVYGPGADEILLRHWGQYGYVRFLLDRHGNVAFLVDNAGVVREKYTYDAFGRPKVTDSDGGHARSWSYYGHCFLFQGREYIRELGIYDYRNRFYHPASGRFLQTDPTGFDAGDMNLFRYCGDDPVDLSDPLGLDVDIEKYRADDDLKNWIHNVHASGKWVGGSFVYAGHGSQRPETLGQVKDPRYKLNVMGGGPIISAANVAKSIKESGAFRTKSTIFLMVCSSGAPGSTLAKDIAAATGKTVIAPDKMLFIGKDGSYFAADPKLSADGKHIIGADLSKRGLGHLVQFNPDGTSQIVHSYLPPKNPDPMTQADYPDGVPSGTASTPGPPLQRILSL